MPPTIDTQSFRNMPSSLHSRSPDMSILSTRATALDVCYSVYGESPVSNDAVDNFYEASASKWCLLLSLKACELALTGLHSIVYENPFVTATSRTVISDIHRLSRQMNAIDVPRPLAMLCTLFRLRPPNLGHRSDDILFQALRIWTDVIDICESESFDGHRKAIVEHTLNILLLPGIHCEGTTSWRPNFSNDSLMNIHGSPAPTSHAQPFLAPSLPIPGTSLSFPSPLHLTLRIITRLSFNEQGLVTHHRDIWDIKDVMGLLPGVSLAQWIGTRMAAAGLSYMSRFLRKEKHENKRERAPEMPVDLETGQ